MWVFSFLSKLLFQAFRRPPGVILHHMQGLVWGPRITPTEETQNIIIGWPKSELKFWINPSTLVGSFWRSLSRSHDFADS